MDSQQVKITIDPLALLEVKYLDMTNGKALTLGEVISMKQNNKFNKQAYTSVNELIGDRQYRKPILPDTKKLSDHLIEEMGIYWKEVMPMPTPRPQMTNESLIDLNRSGVTVDTAGQWDLDYKVLNTPSEYRPQYINVTADHTMMRIATQAYAMLAFSNSPIVKYAEFSLHTMTNIASNCFYGNGSVQGQLSRLRAVSLVSKEAITALTAAKAKWSDLKFDVTDEELTKYLPLKDRKLIKKPTLADTLSGNKEVNNPTFNPKSEEGAPFKPVVKREDCMLYEALTLNRLLTGLTTGPNNWGGVARMKPKAEVYDVSTYLTKTRNIYVLNAGQSSVLSMYIHHVNKLVPDQPLSETNHSLLKRPALTTMAQEYMERFMRARIANERMVCLTYSDNIFVLSKEDGVWTSTSMDGAKMEGTNVSVTMLNNFVDYTLRQDDPMAPLVKTHAQRCINSYGQLGQHLLYVPGMLSGTPMTTLLNSYRMGLMACHSEKRGDSNMNDIIETAKLHGISLTTERSFTIDEVDDLWLEPTTLSRIGQYLDADLLGFSIGCVEVNNKKSWVSILDHTRLCKSMVFNKVEANQHYRGPMMLLIRYITFCTLYITGGWYYPGTASILKAACIEMVESINQVGKRLPITMPAIFDVINSVTSDLGLNKVAVQALTSSMLHSTIPTLETILRITTDGKITGNDISTDIKLKGLDKEAHLLLDAETFRNEGYTATTEQSNYYSRHAVFKPRVMEDTSVSITIASTLPSNPQQERKGIKRRAPEEVETEQPSKRAVASTTEPNVQSNKRPAAWVMDGESKRQRGAELPGVVESLDVDMNSDDSSDFEPIF